MKSTLEIEPVLFKNSKGYKLAGELWLPDGFGPFPTVVFAHGFDSSKRSPRSIPVAEALVDSDIAAFLIDFTGHGDSEGERYESTVEQQVDDLKSAIASLESRIGIDRNRLMLHGSSSGCLVAAMLVLEDGPRGIRAMVLRAPRLDHAFPGIFGRAAKITIPTLFIQGEVDPLLPQTRLFFSAMTAPRELRVIKKADHLFTDPAHFDQVLRITVAWLRARLTMDGEIAAVAG